MPSRILLRAGLCLHAAARRVAPCIAGGTAMMAVLLASAAVRPATLVGQTFRFESIPTAQAERRAADLFARRRYQVLQRDTVLGPETRLAGDLIILAGDVRLEGEVVGEVVLLGGALFVRPGAQVPGPVVVLAGEFFPSGLARIGPVYEAEPGRTVRLEARTEAGGAGEYVVRTVRIPTAPARGSEAAEVDPFALLSYDRVNGASPTVGVRLRPPGVPMGLRAVVRATARTARGALDGEAALELPIRDAELRVEVGRETRSEEAWIHSQFANSVSTFLFGRDARNYYESRYLAARVRGPELLLGTVRIAPRAQAERSDDRSLRERDVVSLFGGDAFRVNPPIDSGQLLSFTGGLRADWLSGGERFAGEALIEHAPGQLSDFGFTRLLAGGSAEAQTFRTQSVLVSFRFAGTVGDRPAPRQRWTAIGGAYTIPTRPLASLRGDQLRLVRTAYRVPLARPQLRLIGSPTLEALHAIGGAWPTGERRGGLHQAVGVGVATRIGYLRGYLDPARPFGDGAAVEVGLGYPRR